MEKVVLFVPLAIAVIHVGLFKEEIFREEILNSSILDGKATVFLEISDQSLEIVDCIARRHNWEVGIQFPFGFLSLPFAIQKVLIENGRRVFREKINRDLSFANSQSVLDFDSSVVLRIEGVRFITFPRITDYKYRNLHYYPNIAGPFVEGVRLGRAPIARAGDLIALVFQFMQNGYRLLSASDYTNSVEQREVYLHKSLGSAPPPRKPVIVKPYVYNLKTARLASGIKRPPLIN